jgi:uncharacterized SAM-binding protein YcdF (DUF218 family)
LRQIIKRWPVRIAVVLTLVPLAALFALNILPLVLVQLPDGSRSLKRSDVIIVLGTPADNSGNASPTMRQRVRAAVRLFKEGYGKQLILTGAAAHNKFVEAEVMAAEALSQGVPADRLVLEPLARNTYQNAFNSVDLMARRGWHSAVVVSSGAHLRRAGLIFSHYPVNYCLYASQDPAEQSIFDRLLFDQREKCFVLVDLSKGAALGLTPEQAARMPELLKAAQAGQASEQESK